MNDDELNLLQNTLRDLMGRYSNEIEKSEKEGFGASIIKAVSEAGVLGARIPTAYGGSGLPDDGYFVVLNEIAKASPSLAVRVLITNSIFYPLSFASLGTDDLLNGICEGSINPAVGSMPFVGRVGGGANFDQAGSRLMGEESDFLNGECKVAIVSVGKELALARDGISEIKGVRGLGLNALRLSTVKVDTTNYTLLKEGLNRSISEVMSSLDSGIAALALGIAEATLNLAIEYTKQREVFGHRLKDYQTIAGKLSALTYETRYLTRISRAEGFLTAGERTAVKMRSLKVAEKATDASVQAHGGYGYFEDFNVERYYRDIIAIESTFVNPGMDNERVSGALYGIRSGYL